MTLFTISPKLTLSPTSIWHPFSSGRLIRLCPDRIVKCIHIDPKVTIRVNSFSSLSTESKGSKLREINWKKNLKSSFLSEAVMSRINPIYSKTRIHNSLSVLSGIHSFPYSTKSDQKILPVGVQSFKKIVLENRVYVDKTALIHQLITKGSWYFLSRPRRFGKSLLVDILNNIFRGEKHLFKGLGIDSLEYDWKVHPVIYLDFSLIPRYDFKTFQDALARRLTTIAEEYDVSINVPTVEEGLIDLVTKLTRKTSEKVVILIDEYDKPLIDHINNIEIAQANRTLLKEFYTTIKGLDAHLRFVFITGVSKFSQVSLFSGLNNLIDITMSADYASLVGYTEGEIRSFFQENIVKLAHAQKQTPEQIIELMRFWYNGYRFSREDCKVYNPFSTLLFLMHREFRCYWYETATPAFLVNRIKKEDYNPARLSGIEVSESVFSAHELEKINILTLMWQTGYLTIHNYDSVTRRYRIDYPNREVQEAFLENLAKEMIGGNNPPELKGYAQSCSQALYDRNLDLFFDSIKNLFSEIPYDMNVAEEKYYQTIFYVIGKLIGLETAIEVKTNIGRIDMVITTNKMVYIIEFKINSTARTALKQINDKRYFQKYLREGKDLVLVGANFSTKERNISEWKAAYPSSANLKKNP